MGRFQISLVAERLLHHRLEVLSQIVSKLFPHSRSPPTDTPGILFIEIAQVVRISEPVEALLGAEPGEAGEEAVKLLASTVGTAERRRIVDIQDEQAQGAAAVATGVLVDWHGDPPQQHTRF